jgi:hypothetical protein
MGQFGIELAHSGRLRDSSRGAEDLPKSGVVVSDVTRERGCAMESLRRVKPNAELF